MVYRPKSMGGGLWSIELQTSHKTERRIVPLFVHTDGRQLPPTSRHVWEQLVGATPRIQGFIQGPEVTSILDDMRKVMEDAGQSVYQDLVGWHEALVRREREKGEHSFASRRALIQRIGLPEVRAHRLRSLDGERESWLASMAQLAGSLPDMHPILLCRVRGGGEHD